MWVCLAERGYDVRFPFLFSEKKLLTKGVVCKRTRFQDASTRGSVSYEIVSGNEEGRFQINPDR